MASSDPNTIPQWDSGRRQAPTWKAQEARVRQRWQRLERVSGWLRRRHGTAWPKRYVTWFSREEDAVSAARERLLDEEYEPFFPSDVMTRIEDELTTLSRSDRKFRTLMQEFWLATEQLVHERQDRLKGIPRLTKDQRRTLTTIAGHLERAVKACGSVADTQALIGNWAKGGLLAGGLNMVEVVNAMAALEFEISLRLSEDGRPDQKPGAKVDDTLRHFYSNVTFALESVNEPCSATLDGTVHRVTDILLKAARQRAPKDPRTYIAAALKALPEMKADNAASMKRWKFLDAGPRPPSD